MLDLNMHDINKSLHEEQHNLLKDSIINGANVDHLLTFNLEAGTGKTLASEIALADLYRQKGIRSVFVRAFVTDGKQSAARINKHYGSEIALAVNSDNKKIFSNTLDDYPILIITHEKYIRLGLNPSDKKKYTNNRTTLVIDEKVNMIKALSYSEDRMEHFDSLLKMGPIRDLYNDLVSELREYLLLSNGHSFFNSKKYQYNRNEFQRLKKLIDNPANQRYLKISDSHDKKYFITEIEELENFHTKTSVVDGKIAYTFNSKYQWWLLSGNNILLDANAGFDQSYRLNPLFRLIEQSLVVDHTKWNLYVSYVNTCATKKKKSKNFYEIINEHIQLTTSEPCKTLIISSLEDQDGEVYPVNSNTKIDHFFNIVGSNDYSHHDVIYILHTPQYPFYLYVLEYLYHTKYWLNNHNKWHMSIEKERNNTYCFTNPDYESIRTHHIAGEIYQAIKRINRSNEKPAKVYLFNHDPEVINIIKKQMLNINHINHDLDPIHYYRRKTKKGRDYDMVKFCKSYAYKFIEFVSKLSPGIYSKAYIRDSIDCPAKNFSRQVLQNAEVIKFVNENDIIITTRNIEIK